MKCKFLLFGLILSNFCYINLWGAKATTIYEMINQPKKIESIDKTSIMKKLSDPILAPENAETIKANFFQDQSQDPSNVISLILDKLDGCNSSSIDILANIFTLLIDKIKFFQATASKIYITLLINYDIAKRIVKTASKRALVDEAQEIIEKFITPLIQLPNTIQLLTNNKSESIIYFSLSKDNKSQSMQAKRQIAAKLSALFIANPELTYQTLYVQIKNLNSLDHATNLEATKQIISAIQNKSEIFEKVDDNGKTLLHLILEESNKIKKTEAHHRTEWRNRYSEILEKTNVKTIMSNDNEGNSIAHILAERANVTEIQELFNALIVKVPAIIFIKNNAEQTPLSILLTKEKTQPKLKNFIEAIIQRIQQVKDDNADYGGGNKVPHLLAHLLIEFPENKNIMPLLEAIRTNNTKALGEANDMGETPLHILEKKASTSSSIKAFLNTTLVKPELEYNPELVSLLVSMVIKDSKNQELSAKLKELVQKNPALFTQKPKGKDITPLVFMSYSQTLQPLAAQLIDQIKGDQALISKLAQDLTEAFNLHADNEALKQTLEKVKAYIPGVPEQEGLKKPLSQLKSSLIQLKDKLHALEVKLTSLNSKLNH